MNGVSRFTGGRRLGRGASFSMLVAANVLLMASARQQAVVAIMTAIRPRQLQRMLHRVGACLCVTTREWAGFHHAAALKDIASSPPPNCKTGTTSNTLGAKVIHNLNHALHDRIAGGWRNGPGSMWGRQLAMSMLIDAGFEDVDVREIELTRSTTLHRVQNDAADRQVVISALPA